jgi:transposase
MTVVVFVIILCVRMGKPIPDRFKKRLHIQTLLGLGWSTSTIAAKVSCNESTVKRWAKRFNEGESEQDRSRCGRPRKINPTLSKKLVTHVSQHRGRSTRKSAKWLATKGVSVSYRTVGNELTRAGQYPYHRAKKPQLNNRHKAARVTFAQNYKDHDWLRTLMTDETQVSIMQTPNSKNDIIWAPKGADVTPIEVDTNAQTLRFWAGASACGRTKLYFFERNLDGDEYRSILTRGLPEMKKIFGSNAWTFQHDGAPAHSARDTNDWLRANVPSFISAGRGGEWPPKSPDLNWIENIWSILKAKSSEGELPTSLEALRRRLTTAWASIPAEVFKNCAESMRTRLAEVVRERGNPLKC